MNRHKRRANKKLPGTIIIDYGNLQEGDGNFGFSVDCYVCGTPHNAFAFVRIQTTQTTYVALCMRCRGAEARIIRKYLNAPDLVISEGGEATADQVLAIAGKRDTTEH